MYELLDEALVGHERVHTGVFHVDAPERAACLRNRLQACFKPVEMIETECSPVLGSHSGPGTVGVGFCAE